MMTGLNRCRHRSLIGFGAAGEEGAKAGANAGAEAAYYKEFGLDEKQVKEIAKNIPNGTAAGFLLIEHLWAKKFKEIAMKKMLSFLRMVS